MVCAAHGVTALETPKELSQPQGVERLKPQVFYSLIAPSQLNEEAVLVPKL